MTDNFNEIIKSIKDEYHNIHMNTLYKWNQFDTENKLTTLAHHETYLGICVGQRIQENRNILKILNKLHLLKDKNLLIIPNENLHFSFLGCADHIWPHLSNLPNEVCDLKNICQKIIIKKNVQLQDLKIISLPNTLIVAGIPDKESYWTRKKLANELLKSRWKQYLLDRYKNYSIPPKIWHITLARYKKQQFSDQIKSLYFSEKENNFGSIIVKNLELVAVNINWNRLYYLC